MLVVWGRRVHYDPGMEIRVLRVLALSLVPVVGALIGLAVAMADDGGSPLVGGILAVGVGALSLMAVAWVRQLPVRPGDAAAYGRATVVKLAIAEVPALVGFVLAVVLGPWWLAVVGGAVSVAAVALAWPSAGDRERHELLYLI